MSLAALIMIPILLGYVFVYDLESTGKAPMIDRVVQIAYQLVENDGTVSHQHESIHNPERPIHPEATLKHKLSDEDVADKPPLSSIRNQLEEDIEGAEAISGFNQTKFDNTMLDQEFRRMGSRVRVSSKPQIDARVLLARVEPHTLEDSYKRIFGKSMENAHQADADVSATVELTERLRSLAGMDNFQPLELAQELSEGNITGDGRIVWNEEFQPEMNFGKWEGVTVMEMANIDPRYTDWMANTADPAKYTWLSPELQRILRIALEHSNDPVSFITKVMRRYGAPEHDCFDNAGVTEEYQYYPDGPEFVNVTATCKVCSVDITDDYTDLANWQPDFDDLDDVLEG